jgi:hypothetical protein
MSLAPAAPAASLLELRAVPDLLPHLDSSVSAPGVLEGTAPIPGTTCGDARPCAISERRARLPARMRGCRAPVGCRLGSSPPGTRFPSVHVRQPASQRRGVRIDASGQRPGPGPSGRPARRRSLCAPAPRRSGADGRRFGRPPVRLRPLPGNSVQRPATPPTSTGRGSTGPAASPRSRPCCSSRSRSSATCSGRRRPGPPAPPARFAYIEANRLAGLLNLDLAMAVGLVLAVPLYLALYVALRPASPSGAAVAVANQQFPRWDPTRRPVCFGCREEAARRAGDGQAEVPAGGRGRHPGGRGAVLLAGQDDEAATPEAAAN